MSYKGINNSSKKSFFQTKWRKPALIFSLVLGLTFLIYLYNLSVVTDITPEEAHYQTEKWVDREVRVSGWLREFQGSTGLHYAIEDQATNRVGIRDYPFEKLQSLVNKRVTLEGKFQYDQTFGIYIKARAVNLR